MHGRRKIGDPTRLAEYRRRYGCRGLGEPDAAEVARRVELVRREKIRRKARGRHMDLSPSDLERLLPDSDEPGP